MLLIRSISDDCQYLIAAKKFLWPVVLAPDASSKIFVVSTITAIWNSVVYLFSRVVGWPNDAGALMRMLIFPSDLPIQHSDCKDVGSLGLTHTIFELSVTLYRTAPGLLA